jgi:hypothetical protein
MVAGGMTVVTKSQRDHQPGFYRLAFWNGEVADCAVGRNDDGTNWWIPCRGRNPLVAKAYASSVSDWSSVRSCERLATIPVSYYVDSGHDGPVDKSLPIIADALEQGRYDEAIAIYFETHWHKIKALADSISEGRTDAASVRVTRDPRGLVFTCNSMCVVISGSRVLQSNLVLSTTHTPDESYTVQRADVGDLVSLVGFVASWLKGQRLKDAERCAHSTAYECVKCERTLCMRCDTEIESDVIKTLAWTCSQCDPSSRPPSS